MFGVGAESRNTPTVYGAPYGLVFKETQVWGANIHLPVGSATPDCNESAALHSYGPDAHCR